MTEFTLTAYVVAGTASIFSAFGSQDAGIKAHVLEKAAPIIADFGGDEGRARVADGLDRILASKRIEKYHWHVALATEMLFAAYGTRPEPDGAVLMRFPEDYIEPVKALGLPSLAEALDVLAYSREVRIPVPIDKWDDVSGQYYFDREKVTVTFGEIEALGNVSKAIDRLYDEKPEVFGDLDADDVRHLVESVSSMLSSAKAAGADLAVFRHGGV
ncbi:hypothetical protein ACRQ1B_01980 [Rhizobium panacihumi]|uniref:hypothetical protein n=1 Tax=Rhizobium panacihumi TaxID=2008450 RepID=UPI003D7BE612